MTLENPPPKYDCSVVIPTRNCVEYLPYAIASVQLQRLNGLNVEVIVVDDGSTDGTAEYLIKEQEKSPSLTVITSTGLGVSNARNKAIAVANSDHIAFLDADDRWWAGKLDSQIAFMRANPACVMSFTDYVHFDTDNELRGTCFEFWKPDYIKNTEGYHLIEAPESKILGNNVVGMSSSVVRRDALLKTGGFCEKVKSCEDWVLWLKLAQYGSFAASSAVTMSYLMRAGSQTANYAGRIEAIEGIISKYRHLHSSDFKLAVKQAEGRLSLCKAESARKESNYREAALFHLKALLEFKNYRTFKAMLSDVYHSAFNANILPRGGV